MISVAKAIRDGKFDAADFRWCYDRAGVNEAQQAEGTARDTAARAAGNANADRAALTPFYRSEMNAQHEVNPEQTNELLNFADSTIGGGGATTAGQAASEAARTRNTSGFAPALDEAARQRQQQLSQANLDIGAQDIAGAKQLNQEGAAGMNGIFGTDTSTMLESMGQQTNDINAQVNAGKSGWFQNLNQMLRTMQGMGANAEKAGA